MKILGIETSCDETAAAVIEIEKLEARSQMLGLGVLSNVVASQVKIHAKTGGVVPEVAARAHVDAILPVVKMAMQNAECRMKNLKGDIDVIAVTAGPGLMTSLSVGIEVARTLAWLWKKPLVAVNHLAGHVYANWIKTEIQTEHHEMVRSHNFVMLPMIEFPALCLIVSGGHTELVLMKKHLDFKVIGSTRDDAAGEAFDKVAKMLGLGYPGGPAVAQCAGQRNYQLPITNYQINSKFKIQNSNQRINQLTNQPINFPRPMIDSPNFDFSFSGLKTAVLYHLRSAGVYPPQAAHKMPRYKLEQICAEFQQAVVDVLVTKTIRAAKKYKVKTVLLGGGVAANKHLRDQLRVAVEHFVPCSMFHVPCLEYTTDNAAMIAMAGYFMARAKQFTPWNKIDVDPNWELGGL